MSDIVVLETTVEKEEDAKRLSEDVVKRGLVACCQIFPGIVSNYFWKGNFEEEKEFLLKMKTLKRALPELLAYLRENHPYEEPELLLFFPESLSPSYLEWMEKSIK